MLYPRRLVIFLSPKSIWQIILLRRPNLSSTLFSSLDAASLARSYFSITAFISHLSTIMIPTFLRGMKYFFISNEERPASRKCSANPRSIRSQPRHGSNGSFMVVATSRHVIHAVIGNLAVDHLCIRHLQKHYVFKDTSYYFKSRQFEFLESIIFC